MGTTNTPIVQTPNDYIDKGINDMVTIHGFGGQEEGKKRTLSNLFFGLGILISANMAKTVMISLVNENQKAIHKVILDAFGLMTFSNLASASFWTWKRFKYYSVGWMFQKAKVNKVYEACPTDLHTIEFVPSDNFMDTLLYLLEKAKSGSIDGMESITFDCNVSDEAIMSPKEFVLVYEYDNILIRYQKLKMSFPRISTSKKTAEEDMYTILNTRYRNVDYEGLKVRCQCSFNAAAREYKIEIEYGKCRFVPFVIMSPDKIREKCKEFGTRILFHQLCASLLYDHLCRTGVLPHVIQVNLAILKTVMSNYKYDQLVSEETRPLPLCTDKTHYNGVPVISSIDARMSEYQLVLPPAFWCDHNGAMGSGSRDLISRLLRYNHRWSSSTTTTVKDQVPAMQKEMSVELKGIESKTEAYRVFQSFVAYTQTISKRQNVNNKINIKTVVVKEEKIEGTTNPEHAIYMEEKNKLLLDKVPLANVLETLGTEPPKKVGASTKREVESVTLSSRYCSFDNLYLRKEQDTVLFQLVESFQGDKQEMAELGVPNKLGILLHGEPGCGKTTTILTIASYFGRDVFYVNLKSVRTNEELKAIFDHVNSKHVGGGIVVFEDLDVMTTVTNKRNSQVTELNSWDLMSESILETTGITLEYLLNLLDGMLTYDDSIVIITTNHLSRLDPALYRSGRMDKVIEVKKCDQHQIRKIFRRFIGRDISEEVLQKIPEDLYTPADVIFHLKLYVRMRSLADEEIMCRFYSDKKEIVVQA